MALTTSPINSKGAVPALKLDNGQVLTEGVAIMQYLADQKPESGLAPKNGTLERYRVQEWLNYITSEVHKSFSPLWNPDRGSGGEGLRARRTSRRSSTGSTRSSRARST